MGVGLGGGQKFVVRRLQAVGRHDSVTANPGRMVTQPTANFLLGGSNPGRRFEPRSGEHSDGGGSGITIWPLRALKTAFPPTAWSRVCH